MNITTQTALILIVTGMMATGTPALADKAVDPVAPVRTRAERDALTPDEVLARFKAGNQRFIKGEMTNRDLLKEQRATSASQYPSAVVLSCMDSRAPAEFLFDKGIGEIFNARIAGNVVNPDLIGSLEYAAAVTGAKLVVVMGHTNCGAIGGAIDHVELGNLTGLLQRIEPAVQAVGDSVGGERKSSNAKFQEAVTRENVVLAVQELRKTSPILHDLEEKGKIKIVGALYDVSNGEVHFLDKP
jgi:carbonic anhydrase